MMKVSIGQVAFLIACLIKISHAPALADEASSTILQRLNFTACQSYQQTQCRACLPDDGLCTLCCSEDRGKFFWFQLDSPNYVSGIKNSIAPPKTTYLWSREEKPDARLAARPFDFEADAAFMLFEKLSAEDGLLLAQPVESPCPEKIGHCFPLVGIVADDDAISAFDTNHENWTTEYESYTAPIPQLGIAHEPWMFRGSYNEFRYLSGPLGGAVLNFDLLKD